MNQNNLLQRYQIKRKISVGGMASVFLAEDKLLGREVALKMMHPHLVQRADAIKRFSIEAKAIATLSHDNIIHIYDYGENHNRPFLVMEYIDGMNLQELLDSCGALPNLVTIAIVRQIVCGLICAHKNGIIHRDIKPANILLNKNGIIRITDFGIAYLADTESVTLTGSFIGSPYFISPEQATNKPVSGACDIFSLGVLLYFCLSGELPFTGDTPHSIINAIVSNKPEDIRRKNSCVLLWLADLVEKCLKKNPAERPTASQILMIIDQQCQSASLSVSCSRIVDFQKSSEEYRAAEIRTLLMQYHHCAAKELRSGKITSAIRKKEQARLLENTQYIHHKIKAAHLPFIFVCLIILLSSSVIFIVFITKSKSYPEKKAFSEDNMVIQQDLPLSRISPPVKPVPTEQPVIAYTPAETADTLKKTPETISAPVRKKVLTIPATHLKAGKNLVQDSSSTSSMENRSPDPACLIVYTNPPWVTVYIDGIERGITPRNNSFQLFPGKHQLGLKKSGFSEYLDTISISAADTLTRRIKLKQIDMRGSVQE